MGFPRKQKKSKRISVEIFTKRQVNTLTNHILSETSQHHHKIKMANPLPKAKIPSRKDGKMEKSKGKSKGKRMSDKCPKKLHLAWWGIRIPVSCALEIIYFWEADRLTTTSTKLSYHWTTGTVRLMQIIDFWGVFWHIFKGGKSQGRNEWMNEWMCV